MPLGRSEIELMGGFEASSTQNSIRVFWFHSVVNCYMRRIEEGRGPLVSAQPPRSLTQIVKLFSSRNHSSLLGSLQ